MRRFVAVAVVCVALSAAVLIGIRALVLNGVYDLGPTITFAPQTPVITEQAPQSSPTAPATSEGASHE